MNKSSLPFASTSETQLRPIADDLAVSRRRALVVLSAVPIAAACGATANTEKLAYESNGDPDDVDAASGAPSTSPTTTPTGTPTSSPTGNPTSAPETGTTDPPDSGTSEPDVGTTPKPDSATSEPDTSTAPPDAPVACTPVGSDVGALSSFPANSWTGQDPIIIGHDSGGLFAYTATCTHQGCSLAGSIDTSSGSVTCPCHGWQFTGTGACLTKSSKPLVHYPLRICDGRVYVDTSTTVASTTRTPAS